MVAANTGLKIKKSLATETFFKYFNDFDVVSACQ